MSRARRRSPPVGDDALAAPPPADPLALLARWLEEAAAAGALEPQAMTLATADAAGRPSARIVLLRGLDGSGLRFFTHYGSRKGAEIAVQPRVALVFHWPELERQARAEGAAERLDPSESDRYFDGRPLGSRISAMVSPQSRVIAGREELERRRREQVLRLRRERARPRRPADWGGYRVVPESFEFWRSGRHRLHDRIRYRRDGSAWFVERLAP